MSGAHAAAVGSGAGRQDPGGQDGPDEWDLLVHALRKRGVRYLAGGHLGVGDGGSDVGLVGDELGGKEGRPTRGLEGDPALGDPVELLCRLASFEEPRLRQAVAALLLVQPELAPCAWAAAARLGPLERERLIEAYVAAVYLQRLWRTRLRRHLGEQPEIPPYWIDELGLPGADEMYGRLGLALLADPALRTSGRARGRLRHGPYEQLPVQLFAQFTLGGAG